MRKLLIFLLLMLAAFSARATIIGTDAEGKFKDIILWTGRATDATSRTMNTTWYDSIVPGATLLSQDNSWTGKNSFNKSAAAAPANAPLAVNAVSGASNFYLQGWLVSGVVKGSVDAEGDATFNSLTLSGTPLAAGSGGTGLSALAANVVSILGAANYAAIKVLLGLDSVENAAASGLYVPLTRTVNGHALSSNVTVTPTDLSLVIGTNVQAYNSVLTTYAGINPSSNVQSFLAAANYAAMRTLLNLVAGTDVQAWDTDLDAFAALPGAADKLPYFTGTHTMALADFSSYARTLMDDADAATARATLGLGTLATQNGTFQNAAADGSTKGVASFAAADFDASSGNISIDYTNGQKATASVPGLLSAADWTTFNAAAGGGVFDQRATCRFATTGNLVANYSNGSSGVGATLTYVATGADTIDGGTIALNDRILVKDQTTAFQNGIYTVTTLGALGIAGIFTRATDFDQASNSEVVEGAYTIISEGTANAGSFWVETGQGAFTMGSTSISFTELAASPHTLLDGVFNNDTLAGTVVLGDIIYGNSTPKWQRLAGNITATKKFLTQTGNGSISAVPGWNVIVAGDIPDISATYQPLDGTLTAWAAYNTNGLLTQTAADTFTGRTITGTSLDVTVTNGSGVSGNPTLTLDRTATLAGDPALAAGNAAFSTTGVIFEGATADTFEGLLTVTDPTADRTWTLPNATGTVALTSDLHNAVTLTANADTNLLNLSTQVIDLDTQSANKIFAGPTSGGADYPAFRSLVAADVPAISLTAGVSGTLPLANGGTAAALSASLGGVFYSTNAAGAILAGTATANKVLMSGASAAPAWSTPTFPNASATSGKFIQSDGTNWIASTPTIPATAGTSGKALISDGTNFVSSTPTFPNASATSGKIIQSDGTNWVASTPTFPAVASTSGAFIRADGTNWAVSSLLLPNAATTGDILIATSSNNIGVLAAAAAGKVLMGAGTSTAPVYSTPTYPNAAPTAGYLISGTGTNFQTKGGMIYANATQVQNPADTGEDTLMTTTLPTGLMGVNLDTLEIHVAGFTASNATHTKRIRLYFGATVLYDSAATGFGIISWDIHASVIRLGATTQIGTAAWVANGGTAPLSAALNTTPGETLANGIVVKVTGTLGTGTLGDITQNFMTVTLVPAG